MRVDPDHLHIYTCIHTYIRTKEVQRRHEGGEVKVEVVEDILVAKDDAHGGD